MENKASGILFRTKDEVDRYFEGDSITCLLCGKEFRAVSGMHLKNKHNMSIEKYKAMFGLPMGKGLVCDATRSKQRDALVSRVKEDPDLFRMSPEMMWKAQHAPKRMHPHYHVIKMRKFAQKGLRETMRKSRERIAGIDWDMFIEKMKETKTVLSDKRGKDGLPSQWDIDRKMATDPAFAEKYGALKKGFTIKVAFKDDILDLTRNGLSQMEISKVLGISETHICRIRRANGIRKVRGK